jgi:hypothetical protein
MAFEVEYSLDAPAQDVDETIHLAMQADPEQPLRVRIQPQVYTKLSNVKGTYLAWRGVFWNMKLGSVEEARAFRACLVSFFKALSVFGAENLKRRLDTLTKAGLESGVPMQRIQAIDDAPAEFDADAEDQA